ncbi:hypothetical protein LTR78_002817 [Recurvomyces mirabilis]|uniref:Uncharacterized protein n=1 Tax=Recurvomyces mirabilis TaxID=574656 RepID=A0AAE0WTF1_9PEZI|nr:hypothetical protein LTR78_002817 [Recurvomyces mirabilis]KAK5159450.1 hypothetical protein LTS14_002592 [Recurvomyces mirabilis]
MAQTHACGDKTSLPPVSEALRPEEADDREGHIASLEMNTEEDDIGNSIAAMLEDDKAIDNANDEAAATEEREVELTPNEFLTKMKESRPDFKVKVKRLCHHLETSGRPYAGRKANALREQIAEIGKLTRRLRTKERKRMRGPEEKAPKRPDYFTIAVRIQELGGLEDAPGSPVAEAQQVVEDEDFVVPATPRAGATGDEGSDFDEPPTKKRKQRKHMNAQQQAEALSKLEAKIREINSAANQPESLAYVDQPGWAPLSPPKNASKPCSPEKKAPAARSRVVTPEADPATLEKGCTIAAASENPALQAQDIAVVSRLALAAKYLSAVSTIESSVAQDLQSFGSTFCGQRCWQDRYAYYDQDDFVESDADRVQWAKAILIGLIDIVELFDDVAADEIDRFVNSI